MRSADPEELMGILWLSSEVALEPQVAQNATGDLTELFRLEV